MSRATSYKKFPAARIALALLCSYNMYVECEGDALHLTPAQYLFRHLSRLPTTTMGNLILLLSTWSPFSSLSMALPCDATPTPSEGTAIMPDASSSTHSDASPAASSHGEYDPRSLASSSTSMDASPCATPEQVASTPDGDASSCSAQPDTPSPLLPVTAQNAGQSIVDAPSHHGPSPPSPPIVPDDTTASGDEGESWPVLPVLIVTTPEGTSAYPDDIHPVLPAVPIPSEGLPILRKRRARKVRYISPDPDALTPHWGTRAERTKRYPSKADIELFQYMSLLLDDGYPCSFSLSTEESSSQDQGWDFEFMFTSNRFASCTLNGASRSWIVR
ncbi:hypothetical protein FA95DRAFT_1553948 [Auriscalpium vulgare]|uniref:Uncharacterized protein n=1 Tax=Auriscalpium vulgare TaxID=40419 RepID=A0ACB8S701_9AGAM|nr:hypothetical protein FA95DRAFT_1553948 [Auriscalpium vulgare]